MATKVGSNAVIIYGKKSEMLSPAGYPLGSLFIVDSGEDTGYEYSVNEADEWFNRSQIKTSSSGKISTGVILDALSNNMLRVNLNSHPIGYSATVVLGFRILNIGTGDLSFVPNTLGATSIVITAAELLAMGNSVYDDWGYAAGSIIPGVGMELLVHVP